MVPTTQQLIELAASVLAGVTVFVVVFALRRVFIGRWERDAAFFERVAFRMTNREQDGRVWAATWYAAIILTGVGGLLLVPTKVFALVVFAGVLLVPRYLEATANRKWRAAIEAQLPPAIAQLANGVQAGMTVVQSVENGLSLCPQPLHREFAVMLHRYHLGEDLPTVLKTARSRIGLPYFDLVTSALLTNRDLGGDIGYTLDRLARSLEGHRLMRDKVRAATAAGRANIKVLGVSPLIILAMMWFVDAEGVTLLFTTVVGQVLLLAVFLLAGIGCYWAWSIVNTEV